MALIEYDEYKQRLRDLGPELEKLSAALDMDSARAEARKLEDETAQDGFWNDLERSQKVQQRLKQLQNKIGRQDKLGDRVGGSDGPVRDGPGGGGRGAAGGAEVRFTRPWRKRWRSPG